MSFTPRNCEESYAENICLFCITDWSNIMSDILFDRAIEIQEEIKIYSKMYGIKTHLTLYKSCINVKYLCVLWHQQCRNSLKNFKS